MAVCSTEELHQKMLANSTRARDGVGILGLEATAAAWSPSGAEWLATTMQELDDRRAQVMASLGPLVSVPPEATYLAWLDAREIAEDPYAFYLERSKVALADGAAFGAPGRGFVRLNFGTTEAVVAEICARLVRAPLPGRSGFLGRMS